MKRSRARRPLGLGSWCAAWGAVCLLVPAGAWELSAQAPPLSSTLRWGTGYLDVPSAAVLPSLALRATYSGFFFDVQAPPTTDGTGAVVGQGPPRSGFAGDAAFSIGFLDRVELGTTVQSFGPREEGGNLFGLFGKALLLDPGSSGLGVAVGARYLPGPDFGDGVAYAPTRLGFQDPRARARFDGGGGLDTEWSLYAVSTLVLPGVVFPGFPENDVTLTAGYGNGLFREGGDLDWYAEDDLNGWFLAAGMDLQLAPGRLLSLQAEHNGMDVNARLEVALGDLRLGVHALGLNHPGGESLFRSRKLGVSVSVTACPLLNRACTPRVRARPAPDTLRLPAPPPDTVLVSRPLVPGGSAGRPVQLCLATGEDTWVLVTATGDTLVGPDRRSMASGAASLPGRYANSVPGWSPEAELRLDGTPFVPGAEVERPACAALAPWSRWGEVPVFTPRERDDPPLEILVPVRPGVWLRYRRAAGGEPVRR